MKLLSERSRKLFDCRKSNDLPENKATTPEERLRLFVVSWRMRCTKHYIVSTSADYDAPFFVHLCGARLVRKLFFTCYLEDDISNNIGRNFVIVLFYTTVTPMARIDIVYCREFMPYRTEMPIVSVWRSPACCKGLAGS